MGRSSLNCESAPVLPRQQGRLETLSHDEVANRARPFVRMQLVQRAHRHTHPLGTSSTDTRRRCCPLQPLLRCRPLPASPHSRTFSRTLLRLQGSVGRTATTAPATRRQSSSVGSNLSFKIANLVAIAAAISSRQLLATPDYASAHCPSMARFQHLPKNRRAEPSSARWLSSPDTS